MTEIVIEQPGMPALTIPLVSDRLCLGRAEDNDVVLVAEEVSRYHVQLLGTAGRYVLVDLKSLNGTYVNRQRIEKRVLAHLDEIWLGSKCRIVFRDEQPSGPYNPQAHRESSLLQDLAKISLEMNEVANSMTMIGRRGDVSVAPGVPAPAGRPNTPPPSQDDMQKMGRAFRRLSALYEVTKIIASDFDLDKRLTAVLDTTMAAVEAERGFIMLTDESSGALRATVAREMGRDMGGSSPSMSIANQAAKTGEPILVRDTAADGQYAAQQSIIMQRIRSAMCVPLKVEDRILGSIYVDVRAVGEGFNEEDLELFASMAQQSAMAIENVRLYEQMLETEKKRANLGRFLSPAIVEKIMQEEADLELGGAKRIATTMFCDVRGFTNLSENLTPDALVDLLNEHFTAMTAIIFANSGTLDKFIGDAIMAVFGSPFSAADDALRAVRAAVAMQSRNNELNALRAERGAPCLEMGIGIATGEVVAGYIGSPDRMEFTVIGDPVNTASRFCSAAGPKQIVIGQQTYEAAAVEFAMETLGGLSLKGKAEPVPAFLVLGCGATPTPNAG